MQAWCVGYVPLAVVAVLAALPLFMAVLDGVHHTAAVPPPLHASDAARPSSAESYDDLLWFVQVRLRPDRCRVAGTCDRHNRRHCLGCGPACSHVAAILRVSANVVPCQPRSLRDHDQRHVA
jgi:hypothetical protein